MNPTDKESQHNNDVGDTGVNEADLIYETLIQNQRQKTNFEKIKGVTKKEPKLSISQIKQVKEEVLEKLNSLKKLISLKMDLS